MVTPKIEFCNAKKLIGMHTTMSLSDNKTAELWKNFMPRRSEILHKVSSDLISMQLYDPEYFSTFQATTEFEKWAAVEVENFENIPTGMTSFLLEEGLYAVFHYAGSGNDNRIFQYIFGSWLPNSNYRLDHRPHFEVLGNKYKNNDPESEELIWIPVKER